MNFWSSLLPAPHHHTLLSACFLSAPSTNLLVCAPRALPWFSRICGPVTFFADFQGNILVGFSPRKKISRGFPKNLVFTLLVHIYLLFVHITYRMNICYWKICKHRCLYKYYYCYTSLLILTVKYSLKIVA